MTGGFDHIQGTPPKNLSSLSIRIPTDDDAKNNRDESDHPQNVKNPPTVWEVRFPESPGEGIRTYPRTAAFWGVSLKTCRFRILLGPPRPHSGIVRLCGEIGRGREPVFNSRGRLSPSGNSPQKADEKKSVRDVSLDRAIARRRVSPRKPFLKWKRRIRKSRSRRGRRPMPFSPPGGNFRLAHIRTFSFSTTPLLIVFYEKNLLIFKKST